MKNKSLILNICTAAVGVLSFIFLALLFAGRITGYQMLETLGYLDGAEFTMVLLYTSPLFILLASIVMLGFAVVNILGATNVIKSEKFVKVSKIITLVAASIFALFAVIAIIMLATEGFSPAIGLILLTIIALGALATTILDKVWSKK
ncbi:MAG: hypothetical protein IJ318_02390 [Clostridia bacterium]|nr:hypothetical protein [Clostridia bacterium]